MRRGAPPHREHVAIGRQRHLHVLDHGQRRERLGDLERAADAQLPDVARPLADQLDAIERDRAAVGRELPVDHIERGRLARAVGADQRQQLAGRNLEADAIDRPVAAEFLAEVVNFQQAHPICPAALRATRDA
jgi:hypothetical protein